MPNLTYIKNWLVLELITPFLEKYPALYISVQRLRYRNRRFKDRLVNSKTDITIEGFPRSANSFSDVAYRFAQKPNNIYIASHTHSHAQLIRSIQLGKPTMLLIRSPVEALTSRTVHRAIKNKNALMIFLRWYNIKWFFNAYARFYEGMLEYADDVVIAPFTEVVKDFGVTMERVNLHFGSNFKVFLHSDENCRMIFQKHKDHLSPSAYRDALKPVFKELILDKKYEKALLRCQRVYDKWMELYDGQIRTSSLTPDHSLEKESIESRDK